MKNMKGVTLGQAPAAILMLVIIGVVAVVGVSINDELRGSTTTANKYLAAQNSTLGIMEVTSNLELLGLIIIMGIVIAVLLASFGGFIRGGL